MRTSPVTQLRDRGIEERSKLPDQLHAEYSLSICRRFLNSPFFFRCQNIACYLSFADEVDTSMIIERAWRTKKRVFVPIIETGHEMRFIEIKRNTRIERNQYGIWEPVSGHEISPRELDVVVTPLVAFDEKLHRIGMGGGYFDRCFSFLKGNQQWVHPKLVGLAFECQKVEKITPKPWDIRLYHVFSESNQGYSGANFRVQSKI
jgi:5-formyltetrahydrofolate cyclo-ligase